MDVPVVISHRTAYALYHSAMRDDVMPNKRDFGVNELGITARDVIARTKEALRTCGLGPDDLAGIELLVCHASERSQTAGARSRTFGGIIPPELLTEVVPGVLVVSPELCFAQAATWLEPLDLMLFGYEVCGRYEASQPGTYRERQPLTNVSSIGRALEGLAGTRGIKAARKALRFVRDGSRSPMETALALMIALPGKEGGLGQTGFEMNQIITVPADLRQTMSSGSIEVDILFPRERLTLEYDGANHAELKRRTHDADRAGTLGLLGYRTRTVTARHFTGKLEIHRALNGIARLLGKEPDTGIEFQARQDALRKKLIADWANGQGT